MVHLSRDYGIEIFFLINNNLFKFEKNWILFPDLFKSNFPIGGKPTKRTRGLSGLTWKCFGAPLNKKECMSNWNIRPLTAAQLKYGALDSFVLIQIHDFIQERCKELNVELNALSSKRNFYERCKKLGVNFDYTTFKNKRNSS